MKVNESVEINAKPEAVFPHFSDPEKSRQWDSSLVSLEVLTEGEFGLGTRVREVRKTPGGNMEAVEEVTTFEPGHKMGWTTIEGKFKSTGEISVVPSGEGSVVNFTMSGKGNLIMTLMSPMISIAASKEIRNNLQTLKGIVESEQAG